jgi:hypothetical protein
MKKIIDFIKKLRYNRNFKKWHKSKIIPCPMCGKPVVNGELQNYETLNEHVTYCKPEKNRPTLICNNPNCKAYNNGFWSEREDGCWFSFEYFLNLPKLVTSYYLGELRLTDYTRKGIYVGRRK